MTTHSSQPRHWLIIPAAGIGSRMAADVPKQYLKIRNKPILQHTVEAVLRLECFERVLIGLHPDDQYWPDVAGGFGQKVTTYVGGKERADSVSRGLKALSGHIESHDWVWVHDAARPLIALEDLQSLERALRQEAIGAVLALPATDTIKRTSQDGVVSTIPREEIWRAQTPQVFRYEILLNAYNLAADQGFVVTDESSAVEAAGYSPALIPGLSSNIKVTVPEDMAYLNAQLTNGDAGLAQPVRIGSGFDVHAFCQGDFLTLGGVRIPFTQGFKAHSDGDVLIHAICDAMLGALALGDIGQHFPDSDEQWKGADSRQLLKAVNALVLAEGYIVANVDATIVAQAPKMAPHIVAMRSNIAGDLNLDVSSVSVKATTSERLGFEGRQEGISCQSSVLVQASAAWQ